jgi:hypothetical protein
MNPCAAVLRGGGLQISSGVHHHWIRVFLSRHGMSSGPFRLGGGEFEPNTWPTRYSLGEERRRTMEAMVAVEPEVLSSLLDDPTWAAPLKGGNPPAFDKAKAPSNRWRERWRLFESWCWEWACDQIRMRGAKARGQKLIITEIRLAPAPYSTSRFGSNPGLGNQNTSSGRTIWHGSTIPLLSTATSI